MKNRDGSELKLQRPNPIMVNQDIWKKDENIILHNKIGQHVILPDENKPKPTPIHLIENEPKKEVIEVEEDDKIQVWCLPASYSEYTDPLYGEKYRKIKYGNKLLLEAVILEQGDLGITMWVNTKAVTEGSILFPRTQDKRWWRVERIKSQEDGYVVYSIISDYQPMFSE